MSEGLHSFCIYILREDGVGHKFGFHALDVSEIM